MSPIKSVANLSGRLSRRDLAVLRDLERFRLLSTTHLQRLHFTDHASQLAASRACARSLRRLEDELGLVSTLQRRIGGVRRGSASFVWQLSSTGDRVLRSFQAPTNRRRFLEPGGPFVKHRLAVNDVAIDLIVAAWQPNAFDLEQLGLEPHNWRRYLSPGGTQWLKPDLHVITSHRDAEGEYEEHAFLEIDLGTEHLPRIEAKCRAYAAYAATGAYQAEHGLFPAVVWLSPDPARRRALSAATAATTGLPAGAIRVADPAALARHLADGDQPP